MRSVVTIFAVAILARIAVTPVWTLIEQADDDTPAASILVGSQEGCEQALTASPAPRAHCESVSAFQHLLGSAGAAIGALRQAADAALQPVEDVQDAALDAVQDAATDMVQDVAVDAVQDAIGGGDDSPAE